MNKTQYYIIAAILAAFAGGTYLIVDDGGEAPAKRKDLTICSFNIQFLGHFKKRENHALANILKPYDIVVVQELVAPPVEGTHPDDTSYSADEEAAAFFEAMQESGFTYVLSEEYTGTNDTIHTSSTSTERRVAFYDPSVVTCVSDIPSGFLAHDRSNHPDYERVPCAFAFRTPYGKLDFVLIPVHLQPGGSTTEKARRKQELTAIADWIADNDDREKDFIILGNMNIEDADELTDATPSGYLSLNDECRTTNTNPNNPKPCDHVMYNTTHTTEIDTEFDIEVINLVEKMEPLRLLTDVDDPGNPYDHHPVVFKMNVPEKDDD